MTERIKGLVCRRMLTLLCCMMSTFTILSAQGKKPGWTVKEPKAKDSYIGIVQILKSTLDTESMIEPNFKDKAKRDALWKIAAQMPWEIDGTKSLFAVLNQRGAYKVSLNDVLLTEIQNSPSFALVGEWESENEYWCYYSVKKSEAQSFIDRLVEKSKNCALDLYAEARNLQKSGHLYRSAVMYIQALDSLHPAIFRYLPVPNDTGFVDLGCLIYEAYLDVYKGVTMTTELKSIPAAYGEMVPGKFSVLVKQGNVPLKKLGIVSAFEGSITATPTTDDEGRCWFSIENVTSRQDLQAVKFSIDTEYLMELPPVYGCNAIDGRHLFPSLKIPVKLFDTRALVKINTESSDSLLRQSLRTLWSTNRDDVAFTERFDSADIIVDVEVNIAKDKDLPTDKYQLTQYSTGLNIKVKGVADDVVLTEYVISDFKLMLPASRSDEKVRQSALREMIRQMNREFPQLIKNYQFDKRLLVWRSLASTEDK